MSLSTVPRGLYCGMALLLTMAMRAASDLPPTVPPPKPVQLPTASVRMLPNGLKVVVIERHSLPTITLHLLVRSGAEADPPDLPGEAQLVGALLNQGTAKRSAQEIARTIDRVGGILDTGAEWDNSFIALRVMADQIDLAFELVSDMATRPAFAPAEIERQRKQALSALAVARNDPAYVADAVFDRLTFAGTPYDHPADGTEESVRRISSEDIRQFYARNYRPSNSILAVVGDIHTDAAFELAARFFSEWPVSGRGLSETGVTGATAAVAEAGAARRIVVIDKPDAVQTEIRIGNRAIPRNNPDYLPLTVANQILGGPATNRLYKSLRIEHGLTYSASSELLCYQALGSWEAKTFTRTSETVKSVRAVLDEMKRLRNHEISGRDLETAQSYLIGHLALETESAEDLATRSLNLLVYNLPSDYWNHFPEQLRAVGTENVLSATRRYLDPERAVIVLVGNASSFSRELKKLGEVRVISIQHVEFAAPEIEAHPSTTR